MGHSQGGCVGVRAQLHRDQVCVSVREKAQRPEKQTKNAQARAGNCAAYNGLPVMQPPTSTFF